MIYAVAAVLPGTAWRRCRVHYADLVIMPTADVGSLVGVERVTGEIGIIAEHPRAGRSR